MPAGSTPYDRFLDCESKPVIVVSQCLGFAAVRYDGQMLQDGLVQALAGHVKFVPVCPEVGIGLGVPRAPIRIIDSKNGRRLVQPSTARDLTEEMRQFARQFFGGIGPVDGFILKSRSPSCGVRDVKTFSEEGEPGEKSAGLFAEEVRNRFPCAAIEDECRLTNLRLRRHFLTRLFAAARFRAAQSKGGMADLSAFHNEYKLQLMAYSATQVRKLDGWLATIDSEQSDKVWRSYAETLSRVMAEPPRARENRRVLLHAFGCLSDRLSARERRHFLALLEQSRGARLPLSELLALLHSWVEQFDEPYLATQTFLQPYPRELTGL